MDSQKLVYRPREAMAALGIGRTLFYELVRRGDLKLIKLGRRSSGVETSSIEAYLVSRRNNAA